MYALEFDLIHWLFTGSWLPAVIRDYSDASGRHSVMHCCHKLWSSAFALWQNCHFTPSVQIQAFKVGFDFQSVPHHCALPYDQHFSLPRSTAAHVLAEFAVMTLSDRYNDITPESKVVIGHIVFVCRQLYSTCEGLLVMNPYKLHLSFSQAWQVVSVTPPFVNLAPTLWRGMEVYCFFCSAPGQSGSWSRSHSDSSGWWCWEWQHSTTITIHVSPCHCISALLCCVLLNFGAIWSLYNSEHCGKTHWETTSWTLPPLQRDFSSCDRPVPSMNVLLTWITGTHANFRCVSCFCRSHLIM